MKRPKTFWSARDELHNSRFILKYTETRFQQFEVGLDTIQMLSTKLIVSHAKMFKLQSQKL